MLFQKSRNNATNCHIIFIHLLSNNVTASVC